MFRAAPLLFVALALLGRTAHAESAVPLISIDPAPPIVRADLDLDEPQARTPWLGLSLGAGIPSGATAELVLRPWAPLRLHAGAAYDLLSAGVLGGVTIAPIHALVTPTLSAAAGHLFDGDANRLIHVATAEQAMLRHVGYDFVSAELGLEIGAPDAFVFALGAGLAQVRATLNGAGGALGLQGSGITAADPTLRAVIPAAHLGVVFYL